MTDTTTLMSSGDYNKHLAAFSEAAKVIRDAPLEDLLAYTEHVEKWAQNKPEQVTPEKLAIMRATARILSAGIYMRATIQLGGTPIA